MYALPHTWRSPLFLPSQTLERVRVMAVVPPPVDAMNILFLSWSQTHYPLKEPPFMTGPHKLLLHTLLISLTLGFSLLAQAQPLPTKGSPTLGQDDALVTIVEFSDYQCPFCQRASATLKQVQSAYKPGEVRLVFKNFPLAFHKEAEPAARAALAAGKQGKYWEMHDLLFENYKNLSVNSADIKGYTATFAYELGLDVARFRKDFDDPAFGKQIREDQALGTKLGVRGTPHFFINGARLSGAQPAAKFKEVIDAELIMARALIASGKATRESVHEESFAINFKAPEAQPSPPSARKPDAPTVVNIPVSSKDPVLGSTRKALVTIVEFSDFQCPFCSRGARTIAQLEEHYGKDVRIVFKHLPLPFHKEAEPAARAAYAAQQQGKFWLMHDLIFARQRDLKSQDPELWIALANEAGIKDIKRFEKDMNSQAAHDKVEADKKLAAEVGARGTPTFFVNGIKLVGAQPLNKFKELIDPQLELAKKLKKKKSLTGEALYKALLKENIKNAPALAQEAAPPSDTLTRAQLKKLRAHAKGAPTRGNIKTAEVVVYEFTDLQCPYCARSKRTLEEVEEKYGADVAIVSLAFPLAFHKQAEPAARAAYAAHKQGKFWEMRAAIFSSQRELAQDEIFDKLASDIGLDLKQFTRDMNSKAIREQVQQDMALGAELGVRGTPNFFVEDEKVVGAQPLSKFVEVIDAKLKN